jgi:Fur family transcriptional regulator, ferric uptake regulator
MLRNTRQRNAILAAIRRTDRPLSPEEILDGARREVPGLGIATVYRHLKALCEGGELRGVALPEGGRRYEAAGKDHHHHFRCRFCDRLFEMDGCPGDLRELAPRGFLVENHDILLTGLCTGCREAQR